MSIRSAASCCQPLQESAVPRGARITRDGTATAASPGEGNFDGGGWSYDAALLPGATRFLVF